MLQWHAAHRADAQPSAAIISDESEEKKSPLLGNIESLLKVTDQVCHAFDPNRKAQHVLGSNTIGGLDGRAMLTQPYGAALGCSLTCMTWETAFAMGECSPQTESHA
jgi:hypothetical protein